LLVHVRDEIRFGITRNVNLRPALRYTGTDVLYYSLLASVDENVSELVGNIFGPNYAHRYARCTASCEHRTWVRARPGRREIHVRREVRP
jgi:hypothetical protein